MVDIGTECTARPGCLPNLRKTFCNLSAFHRTGHTDAFITSFPLDHPFIILSGKLTEKINNVLLLQVGLVIFSLSGILYMLSTKMWQLITVSALLGIGSGLIVPLSTGLISRFLQEHTVRNSSGSVPPLRI